MRARRRRAALALRAGLHHRPASRSHPHLVHAPSRRLPRLEDGARRRHPDSAAVGGHAPDVRPERRAAWRGPDVAPDEGDGARRGRDPRVHRRSEPPEEREVDRTLAELGIEAADDVALRTRDLVLDGRARDGGRRRDDDPRARRSGRRPGARCTRSSLPPGRRRRRVRARGSSGRATATRLTEPSGRGTPRARPRRAGAWRRRRRTSR